MDPLSPLDGRYASLCGELSECIGNDAMTYLMYSAEVEWLCYLSNIIPTITPLPSEQLLRLSPETIAEEVRKFEKSTGHEVKAVEYYLKRKLKQSGKREYAELVHFGLTSEDITNIAYATAIKRSIRILDSRVLGLAENLAAKALAQAGTAMLARTHGQPASPTTLGKEIRNYERRLTSQLGHLKSIDIVVKLSGATGNYNALYAAYPDIDWVNTCKNFIRGVTGFRSNLNTTQVEPSDWLAAILHALIRINNILLDLSYDMWQYISLGYFKLNVKRVGSSTMPHKVNPIEFENAEGNFGLANALLTFMASKLPVSRLQRDLSGSTVKRNLGVAFGHCLVGYKSVLSGLEKLEADKIAISCDLSGHPEVLAEAYQTVLRKHGVEDAYETVRNLFTDDPSKWDENAEARLQAMLKRLPIPEDEKQRLLEMTPSTYIGAAEHLATRHYQIV